jgi:hypothetical protein
VTDRRPPPPPLTQPRAFGCAAVLAVLVFFGFAALFLVIFLESGANTGELELKEAEAYARGSYEFVGERNFFIVRLADGTFLALSDLDAANRAAEGRRCRVAPIATADPTLPGLLERYRSRLHGPAEGATLLFREDCNGALYSVLGERLDADAPNLDRYEVTINERGRVVVDVSRRRCSTGPADAGHSEIQCP